MEQSFLCVLLPYALLGIPLVQGRMVDLFESGSGCGVLTPIRTWNAPIDVDEEGGCIKVSFPAVTEFTGSSPDAEQSLTQRQVKAFGGWSEWTQWTQCTSTCGSGQKTRGRQCDSSQPEKYCPGPTQITRYCNAMYCPVNGVWSEWSAWDSCASDCSKVKEYRNRACDNPRPKHAGSLCDGATQEERDCTSEAACPGAWAIWGVWSPCHSASGSCGLGTGSKQRNRTCSNPPPRNGGPDCEGNEDQSTGCDVTCPVHGGWSTWASWETCDTLCGSGSETRERTCTNPVPEGTGAPCAGPSEDTRSCDVTCRTESYDVGEFNGPLQYEQSWAHCSNTHHVTNFATAASTREGINALVMFCNDPAQTRLVSWTSYGAGNLAPAMTDCPSGYTKAKAMIVQVRIIDNVGMNCLELYCSGTNAWARSECTTESDEVVFETSCPENQVICGYRVKEYNNPFLDNMGLLSYIIVCCHKR